MRRNASSCLPTVALEEKERRWELRAHTNLHYSENMEIRLDHRYTVFMPATIFLASKADQEFAQPIVDTLNEFGVQHETVMASAHKAPEKVIKHITMLNEKEWPMVVIAVVGMSNGLGGMLAANCLHPVITCPVLSDITQYQVHIHSSLQMPKDVPLMTVLHPVNAALAAVRILAVSDPALKEKVAKRMRAVKATY